ncbi:dihydroxyacetone kinase subunit DhaK [Paraliobacillus ryukyuensis]|uniref:dihydroxyacetone kinase subunit DhaK n=1 Tax=Paraliobacillus ryukyuensis TaxID=200904 RepID=UPI0009A61B38|nr:dihydroxyacetone kinase subunit DhaK [Paraliobacillus ryukyuensis]
MKKIINNPSHVVDEMLEGFAYANSDLIKRVPDTTVIVKKSLEKGKVGLVSGGGSGHEPSHAGFVGKGMLTAAVAGEVFTSPSPDQVLEGIRAADQGEGVLLIIKNYSGDVMNFEMAAELAETEDITVKQVIVDDDIAVEDSTHTNGRRGVAGTIIMHKVLGAAAEQGSSLTELKQLGDELVKQIKTIGVALTPATVPEVGKPGFTLDSDEMEYGVGIHGEPGYRRESLKSSRAIADELIAQLKKEYQWAQGESFGLLVNGLGATPLMEQYLFINDVREKLEQEGITIKFKKVGSLMTSLDMAGVSMTLVKIKDDKWLEYWSHPVEVVGW